MAYRIEVARAAQKGLLSIPLEARAEISCSIDRLSETPRPAGCKKLLGTQLWRIRAGRYRIIYFIDDAAKRVLLLKIARRKEDAYRGLQ